jgi:hypothetical protein
VITGTIGLLLTLSLNLAQTVRLAAAGSAPVFPHGFNERLLVLASWGFLVPFVWVSARAGCPRFSAFERNAGRFLWRRWR